MVSPKIGPSFFGKNYEKYVSELTTEGTIAGENLTPEERKEGFKKKDDKIDFKNFLEKVLERLPPDSQKKITEGGIGRVNFDRYDKKISANDVRKSTFVDTESQSRDLSAGSVNINSVGQIINPEQLFGIDDIEPEKSISAVKSADPERLVSEIIKTVDSEKILIESSKSADPEKVASDIVKVTDSEKISSELIKTINYEKLVTSIVKVSDPEKISSELIKTINYEKLVSEIIKTDNVEKIVSELVKTNTILNAIESKSIELYKDQDGVYRSIVDPEVKEVVVESLDETIPDGLDDLLKDISDDAPAGLDDLIKSVREEEVKPKKDDRILENIKETNKNLLETNEILYGLIKSLQKEMVEDKKKAFKEKDRLRKEQRKASFASAGTGRKLTGPKLRKPKLSAGGLFDNPLFKFLGLSALAGLVEFIPKIINFIETLPERINHFFTVTIPSFITRKFGELRDFLGEKFSEIGTTISEKFNEFRTFATDFFTDRFNEVKQFFEDIYTKIDDFTGGKLTEFIEGIKGLGPMIVEKSQEFYKTIDDWTGGRISGAFDWIGKNVIDPMGAFFKEKIDYVGMKAGELWTNFSSSFLNFFGDINFELPDLGVTELTSNVLGLEPAGGVRVTGDERDYLKRLMIAEAGGEGEVGMAAVGRSVMNRAGLIQSGQVGAGTFNAKSGSITDVINAPKQYQPVRQGKLNRQLTPEEDARAERALQMAENQDMFTAGLKSKGVTSEKDIKKISASTGFRTGDAFNDSSQNVNTTKLGGHIFNTAGNEGMTNAYSEINFVGDNTRHGTPGAGIPTDPGFNAGKGDKSKRIFLHWTAADYNTPFDNYHTTFLGDGKAVRNTENYGVYKGTHTQGANTNSVGLSIAAAGGAKEGQTLGKYPPTGAQLNAMALEAARLAVAWGWDASTIDKNVMTHGEWERKATSSGILPGRPQRWDLDQLFSPSEKVGSGKSDGGNYMRKLIKKYYVQLKSGGSQREQPRRQPSSQPVSRALTTTLDNIDSGQHRRLPDVRPTSAAIPKNESGYSGKIKYFSSNGGGNKELIAGQTYRYSDLRAHHNPTMRANGIPKDYTLLHGRDINNSPNAEIPTPLDGKVTGYGVLPGAEGYGKAVELETASGGMLFAHLSKLGSFKEGDVIKAGTIIGTQGSTGGNYEDHLHLDASQKGHEAFVNYITGGKPMYRVGVTPKTDIRSGVTPAPAAANVAPSQRRDKVADSLSQPPSRASRSRVSNINLPAEVRNNPTIAGSSGGQSSSTENYVPRVSTRTSSDIYQINTRALFNIVG